MTDVQPTSSQRITNPDPVVPYGMVLLSTWVDLIGVATLTRDAVIQFASVTNRTDYW